MDAGEERHGWISPELVARARAGDAVARQELLTRSAEIVRSAIFNAFSGRPPFADIEDIAQDVYARVLEKLVDLRHEETYPRWLYKIATNRCRDLQRAEKRPSEALLDSGEPVDLEVTDPLLAQSRERFAADEEALDARVEAERLARSLGRTDYELLRSHHALELAASETLSARGIKKTAYYERIKVVEHHALLERAIVAKGASHYTEAKRLLRTMLATLPRLEESREKRYLHASSLTRLADILQVQGSILGAGESLDLYQQALAAWRALRDQANVLYTIHMMGLCYNIADRLEEALAVLGEVEEQLQASGSQARALGDLYRDLGSIYLKADNVRRARMYSERSLPLLEGAESAAYYAALRKLGEVRLREGKADRGLSLLEHSLYGVPIDQALL